MTQPLLCVFHSVSWVTLSVHAYMWKQMQEEQHGTSSKDQHWHIEFGQELHAACMSLQAQVEAAQTVARQ